MEAKEIISEIKTIYSKYGTPLHLQKHMLRSAAVAELICDNLNCDVVREDVIGALLLHDLGNIVKMHFDDETNLKFLEKDDLERVEELKQKQKEFINKYGDDDLEINHAIAKELGVSQRIEELLNEIGFKDACQINESNNLELMLRGYCDWRVGIFGILSLDERIEDVKERYTRKGIQIYKKKDVDEKQLDLLLLCAKEVEKKIISKCKIKPEDITDESIKPYLEKYF